VDEYLGTRRRLVVYFNLPPGEITPDTHLIRNWVSPRAVLDVLANSKSMVSLDTGQWTFSGIEFRRSNLFPSSGSSNKDQLFKRDRLSAYFLLIFSVISLI
jgi:hypothetical protein